MAMQDILETIRQAAQPGATVSSAWRAIKLMAGEPAALGRKLQEDSKSEDVQSAEKPQIQVLIFILHQIAN